jgi:Ca-activated chloride channel family protein
VLLLLSDGEDHGFLPVRSGGRRDLESNPQSAIRNPQSAGAGEGGPQAAARAARDRGLIIHTIGVGQPTGAKIPVGRDLWDRPLYKSYHGQEVITRLHEETLQRIATLTGGLYLRAANSRAIETLQRSLRTLQKKAIRGHTVAFRRELFQGFLLGAIFLLALESVLPSRLRRAQRRETIA